MAPYNARIDFSADAKKVEQAIDRIEQRLNRLRDKAAKISLGDVGGGAIDQQKLLPPASKLTRFEQTTKAIADSAKRASTALKGLAVAGGALAGADAINALGKSLEKASVSINSFGLSVNTPIPALNQLGANLREATAGIEPFVQALQSAGAGGLTTAAGIATATTAFVAFEPAITAALDKLKVSEKLFRLLSPAIKDTEINFDGYIKKIRRATDVVSNLRESQRIIRRELDNVNSSTEEAADTAGAYVRVTERLNDELRAQADLLRQVRGFTVENVATGEVRTLTELEATKGRQSIATRQRAAEFRGEQYNRAVEVTNSWKEFFKEADEAATSLKEEVKRTKGEQYNRAVEIRNSWNEFFEEAYDVALKLRSKTIERGQTVRNSWNEFFVEATNLAEELRQQTARVSLREQERKIKVQETISRGRSTRIARERSEFLTGTSGNKPLGPLLGPGGAGFPVALPLTAAEEAVLQQKRRAAELSGLQKNLAKLAVAEAEARLDSARAAAQQKGEEEALLRLNEKQLRISKEATLLKGDAAFSPVKGREDIEGSPAFLKARTRRRKEALSNAIIGGAFPLLFGQGAGAAAGGGLGGAAGGLVGGQFGFGLSLVGTALGTAVDTFSKNISNLASSLSKPVEALEAFEEAGFKVDDSVKANVESLLEVGNAYEAQALVLKEISDTLGPQAVSQLAAYNEEIKKLEKSFQDSYAALASELLPIMLGFVTTINKLVAAFDNMPDWLKNLTSNIIKGGAYTGPFGISKLQADLLGSLGEDRAKGVQPPEAVAEAESLKVQQDKALQILNQNKELNAQRDVLEAQLALASSGLNITTEQGYELAKKVIYAEEYEAVQRILNQNLDKELTKAALLNAELRKKLAIQQLDDKRASELERQNKGTPSRALSLQRSIIAEEQKQVDIAIQYAALQKGDLAGLKAQRDTIVQRQDAAIQMLALERQQTLNSNKVAGDTALINDLYDSRLETLKQQYGFEQAANAERIRAILLEEKLTGIRRRQQKEALSRELGQEIQSLALPTGNIYADPFTALERDQRFRRENIFADLRNQEELLQESLTGIAPKDAQTLADIDLIKKKRAEYEALLPVIEQNQKAQLVYNETLSQIQGPINSLIGGFQQVIAGTKSVEEAFADFLKTIADQLLQTAATMIAQYIALGIARAFAFGSSPQTPSFTAGLGTGLPLFGNYEGLSSIPFLANGGPATANSPYIVGERGPELFVPNSSGNVIPNDALGGTVINITNNISDEGSTSKTDAAGSAKSAADQLSKLMVAVIQREQRPGGVLSRR